MNRPITIAPLLAVTMMGSLISVEHVRAANLIFSNLVELEDSSLTLKSSAGQALPLGAMVKIVTFPGLSASEIDALAAQGPESLLAASNPVGDASSIGTGADGAAGRIEFRAAIPLSTPLTGAHLVVLNQATPEASTEVLVLRIKDTLPADGLNALPGYLAIFLDRANLVYGAASSAGFFTQSGAIPANFHTWIQTQIGVAENDNDYLPDADPDADNQVSVIEYGLGSEGNSPSSIGSIRVHLQAGAKTLRFLERTDDSSLSYTVEGSQTLASETWQPLTTPVTPVLNPTEPAPLNYRWVECAVPAQYPTQFLRLDIELSE